MRKTLAVFCGIVLVGTAAAVVSTAARAQCLTGAREFASVGGGKAPEQLWIDTNGAHNQGLEIGRFWNSEDSTLGNNFEGNCESQQADQIGGGWWQAGEPPYRGIRGFISGTGCSANTCPEDALTVLVEDWGPSGPPGVGDTAYFVVFRVDRTAGQIRDWDYARVDGVPGDNEILMHEYPQANIVGVAHLGGGLIELAMHFTDVDANAWGVEGPGEDNALPTAAMIESYDLMLFLGMDDPGRDRGLWTEVASVPYQSGGVYNFYATPCGDLVHNVFLAIGITFRGGPQAVESALVGPAIEIECLPNVADPRPIIRPGARPRTPVDRRSPQGHGRAGGR